MDVLNNGGVTTTLFGLQGTKYDKNISKLIQMTEETSN